MVTFETLKANCVHSGERSGFSDTCIHDGWGRSKVCRADQCPLLGGERTGPCEDCRMSDAIIALTRRISILER